VLTMVYETLLCKGEEERLRKQQLYDKNSVVARELTLPDETRGAEVVVIRERLVREFDLPSDFQISRYIEEAFAERKLDFAAISPLTWLPLIPAFALVNAVDLANGVVSPQAANAADASGHFLATTWVFVPEAILQCLKLLWGTANFYKMAQIKSMLVPRLCLDTNDTDSTSSSAAPKLIPRLIEDAVTRKEFVDAMGSDPVLAVLKPFERYFAREPTNRVEELFGGVGAAGPRFYFNSIKLHTWLCVTSILGFAAQIVPRDIAALASGMATASPASDLIVPEIVVFGSFAALNFAQLLLAPTTFLNFLLINCVEDCVKTESGNPDEERSSVASY